ncbi:MAG: DUF427 domain-containing protein [Paracoccaceae bacterium]|jgi:class 3 adenylate cyclase/uncharacterized protein (DUF427 family)
MNVHVSPNSETYGIDIQPLAGRVTLRFGGEVLAQSDNAKVMYETRLKPTVYFPPEDVAFDLTDGSDLQTFCPFKGTAHYRNLTLADTRLENAVWMYDAPMPEAKGISGHIGFTRNDAFELDLGDNNLRDPDDGNIAGPVIDWLLREAAYLPTPEAFTEALAEKFVEHGIYLSRMSVLAWSLHPMIAGKNIIWKRGEDEVTTFAPSYEIHDHPAFVNSPLRHVSAGLGGVRHRIADEDPDQDSFPILDDLRKEGATDYVAMPLPFTDGRINVMTLTSDHPKGFSTANLGLIFECSAVIARFYEVFMQRENAQSLLETYVGKRSGARVLGGEIRRGDGDEIDAAIMFCDLRGSTRLEEELGRAKYISVLNGFFETTSEIVHAHGGEVLKFIGDAVLAVFPAGSVPEQARKCAVTAAQEMVTRVREIECADGVLCDCSIGIDFGSVTYGNVGSQERLDFTVIGHAANVAARLGDYGKKVGKPIVLSATVAAGHESATSLGTISLHNVSRPVEGYGLMALPTG